jgi:hypothetical protein
MADLSLGKKPMALFGAAFAVLALAVFAAGFMTGMRYGRGAGDETRVAQAEAPAPEFEQAPAEKPPEARKPGPEPETGTERPRESMAETDQTLPSVPAVNETKTELAAPEQAPVPEPKDPDTAEAAKTADTVETAEAQRNATVARAEPETPDEPLAEAPAEEPAAEVTSAEEPPAREAAKETALEEPTPAEEEVADTAVEAGPAGAGYLVQAASFRSRQRALEMAAELGTDGSPSGVIKVFDSEGKPWYVVHVGWYPAYDEAMAAGSDYESRRGASFTVREMDAAMLRNRTVRAEKEGAGG